LRPVIICVLEINKVPVAATSSSPATARAARPATAAYREKHTSEYGEEKRVKKEHLLISFQ